MKPSPQSATFSAMKYANDTIQACVRLLERIVAKYDPTNPTLKGMKPQEIERLRLSGAIRGISRAPVTRHHKRKSLFDPDFGKGAGRPIRWDIQRMRKAVSYCLEAERRDGKPVNGFYKEVAAYYGVHYRTMHDRVQIERSLGTEAGK